MCGAKGAYILTEINRLPHFHMDHVAKFIRRRPRQAAPGKFWLLVDSPPAYLDGFKDKFDAPNK